MSDALENGKKGRREGDRKKEREGERERPRETEREIPSKHGTSGMFHVKVKHNVIVSTRFEHD